MDFAATVAAIMFGSAALAAALKYGQAAIVRAQGQEQHAKSQMLYAISDHEWCKHRIATHRDVAWRAEFDAMFDDPEDDDEGGAPPVSVH